MIKSGGVGVYLISVIEFVIKFDIEFVIKFDIEFVIDLERVGL